MVEEGMHFITPEGHLKAQRELDECRKARVEIAERIDEAKAQGDLSENAEYQQAKEDFAFNEGRLAQLEDIVRHSMVVSHEKGSSSIVELGCTVRVRSEKGEREYTIVGAHEADPLKGKISQASPLGDAFVGRAVNDVVEVKTPSGTARYTIVGVE